MYNFWILNLAVRRVTARLWKVKGANGMRKIKNKRKKWKHFSIQSSPTSETTLVFVSFPGFDVLSLITMCRLRSVWAFGRIIKYYVFKHFFFYGATAPTGPGSPHYRDFTITLRHSTLARKVSSGRVISPTQRPLPDNTQHLHAPGGNRTHNPSKTAAANPRLRPCRH